MPAKLDLSGINFSELGKTRVKRNLKITQPTISIRTEQVRAFPVKQIFCCICIIITCIFVINIPFSSPAITKRNYRKGNSLRKMIRMRCRTRQLITHCTTSHAGGDYVVSIKNCKDVYEFNGIPFTDVYRDPNGNYRVPGSADSTLKIKDACTDIAATVDTDVDSNVNYASSSSSNIGIIQRVVWITSDCYSDFTVSINQESIYESTPTSMIQNVKLDTKIAYIYEPDVDYLEGAISIRGTGCDSPIMIYTQRK